MNKLIETAANEAQWLESAQGVVMDDWVIEDEVERASQIITNQIVKGMISVTDLRRGVAWANALDAEAVRAYGSDISEGEERLERTARRIMHLSGRAALENVKSRRRLSTAHILKNVTA